MLVSLLVAAGAFSAGWLFGIVIERRRGTGPIGRLHKETTQEPDREEPSRQFPVTT